MAEGHRWLVLSSSYLKLFEEDLGKDLSEVGGAEDWLNDDNSPIARVHQQMPGVDETAFC